jgi:drug/metabolite transporter (DMT)-like permease
MSSQFKGYAAAILSSATFGTIPLFSIPTMAAGMGLTSVLVYRFAFGCMFMLLVMLWQRQSLHITWAEGLEMGLLGVLYASSSVFLYLGYNYMPSGIATTLLFSYPVWTAILMVLFCHEPLSWSTALAIVLAVGGVACLGFGGNQGGLKSLIGVVLELLSGLAYAVYMVIFPHLRVRKLPALKVNFYIFSYAMVLLALYTIFTEGKMETIVNARCLISLILLGLLPTTVSNVSLVKALTLIDSTHVAILGAFEPLTAMAIGIAVFGEPLTFWVVIGFGLIIAAVVMLMLFQKQSRQEG